jgi:hypothetical protein
MENRKDLNNDEQLNVTTSVFKNRDEKKLFPHDSSTILVDVACSANWQKTMAIFLSGLQGYEKEKLKNKTKS